MTVKRQYTLPYCNLVLEGLGADANDPLSPLTVLMNAECHLPGATTTALTGGREFLDSLVAAVSRHGQELLSGVARPATVAGSPPPLVDVKSGDGCHHLIVRQSPWEESTVDANALAPLDVKLTTVQFYDLMEAVDQLLADTQTLPDLQAQFQAVSRRLVKPAEPIAKRAAPAALGAAALAAAGLALFFVPPPEFEPSRPDREADSPAETSTNPNATGSNPTVATPDSADSPQAESANLDQLANAPAITDAATLALLQRDLTRRLQSAWAEEPRPSDDLAYRVVVSEDGDILGYKYDNDRSLAEVDRTPLPELAFDPVANASPVGEPVAQFLATFTPTGQVVVEPWGETEVSPGAEANQLPPLEDKITDGDRIRRLNRTLYDNLLAELQPLSASEALTYRVRLSEAGDMVGYEPVNAAAGLLVQETPLPILVAKDLSPSEQADFMVVFTENGILQVSPWDGWPQ
jgi:hypothetical protein